VIYNVKHDDAPAHARGRRLMHRAKDEVRKTVVIVVYLWLVFGLLGLHEMLLRRKLGLAYQAEGLALINALVLGKVMLIAEDLNLVAGHRGRPLIYAILRKALLFSVLFVVFHIAEKAVVGLVSGSSVASGVTEIGGGGPLDLLTIAAILFVALVPYFAFKEITQALGWPTIRKLLFVGSTDADDGVARTNAGGEQRRHCE
jgi:hypothetical protein